MVTHRPANLDDCSLLAELNLQLIRDEGHRNPMSVEELELRMRKWLSGGGYRAILFECDAAPVAYTLYRIDSDSQIYLRQFFVCAEKRRQGFGRQAVEMLCRRIFPAKTRITLDVLYENEVGRSFWVAAGFTEYSLCLERFTDDDKSTSSPSP
ncbi:MAG: GNAT family N-acetyltransferase [Verrucomicrobia bacterium]|nr:GNAT family N-acetyltransferase [Verrucomicrobiota bacterium]